jgi:hypothetical protein
LFGVYLLISEPINFSKKMYKWLNRSWFLRNLKHQRLWLEHKIAKFMRWHLILYSRS